MNELEVTGRHTGRLLPPRRNNYYYSKLLDVPHLQMEQRYGRDLRYLLNRLSLGTGVLCGLGVEARDGRVCVLPGVAVDDWGREVVVPERVGIDPWQLTDGHGRVETELPRDADHTVTLCLAYQECLTDYAPVLVTDCPPKESSAPGTVVEAFRIDVRQGAPEGRPAGLSAEICRALFGPEAGAGWGAYEVVATISVGGSPTGIAVAADGRRALVLNTLEGSPRLQVIDVATGTMAHELDDERLVAPFGGVSVAPEGGPALITHAGGVAVVDLAADPPVISDNLLGATAYGAGAAAFGGEVLFALNQGTGQVDRIAIGDQVVEASIDVGPGVVDLAVSPPDSRWLYAALAPELPMARVDTNDNQVSKPAAGVDRPARSLAVRATPSGPEAWVAYPGLVRVLGPTTTSDHQLALDPRDSAFTGDGGRYYLVSGADAATGELAVLEAAGRAVLARVPVGARPAGLAIVPGSLRALITSTDGGSVSVVDLGPVDRHRLVCELLAGPCPPPAADPCVPLATVRLLPEGKVGPIDPCAHRPLLLSNAVLLDLILCLAARVEDCCGRPPPQAIRIEPAGLPRGRVGVPYPGATIVASGGTAPYILQVTGGTLPPGLAAHPSGVDSLVVTGTPTQAGSFGLVVGAEDAMGLDAERNYVIGVDPRQPPPPPPLRIDAVHFLERGEHGLKPFEQLTFGATHHFDRGRLLGIRVAFNREVDITTVTTAATPAHPPDEQSFLVRRGPQVFPGRIVQETPETATFLPAELFDRVFPEGAYQVVLFGEDGPGRRAIRAGTFLLATRLDGEGLSKKYPPSGDGKEGGNFQFSFTSA
jgi:DNA-binding beta-propeller fold protein YncE